MAPQRKTLQRKANPQPLPPEAITEVIDGHAQGGPISLHRPQTLRSLQRTEASWIRFCSYMSYGAPDVALEHIQPSTIIGYLIWRFNQSIFEGHRRSTVRLWWKVLSQLHLLKFRRSTSLEARAAIREALSEGGYLVTQLRLNINSKEYPVIDVDDFYDILFTLLTAPLKLLYVRTENQRQVLCLFEAIAGYTGCRPGDIVAQRPCPAALKDGQKVDKFATVVKRDTSLKYRDCKLVLFPGEAGQEFGHWTLEITPGNTKGGVAEGEKPVTYPMFATPCLAQCPIMWFVTQAFKDKAIKSRKILTPEHFWTLKIPSRKRVLEVKWTQAVMDTPILQNDDRTALNYDQLRERLVHLGKAAGYSKVLTTYCTRRGFVNAIHSKVSSAQQNQAMRHTTNVFERHYLSGRLKADMQTTFLGLPTQDKLISIFSSMRRFLDPARPTKINELELQQAYTSSKVLQKLHTARVQAMARCQKLFGSVARSKGSLEHEIYFQIDRDQKNTRRKTAAEALKAKQQEYDDSTDDIDNQIDNIPDAQPEREVDEVDAHPLRKRLNTTFFAAEIPQAGTREDVDRRISAMNDLLALYTLEHALDMPIGVSGRDSAPVENDTGSSDGDECAMSVDCHEGPADDNPDCVLVTDDEEWAGFSSDGEDELDSCSDTYTPPDIISPETKCENPSCASTSSIQWSKTSDGLLCNACRQYRSKHQGKLRPAAALRMSRLRTRSLRHCANALCGASLAWSAAFRYQASCGWLCDPCADYFQKRGCLPPTPLKSAKPRRRRDTGCHSVDAKSDLTNGPPADLMAPAYLHLKVNSSLLGQCATASMLPSELTPPLTQSTSSRYSSATSQSLSWLEAPMSMMDFTSSTAPPFIETLSREQIAARDLQRPSFDHGQNESPLFSDFEQDYMNFEWSLKDSI